ncbi:MAG: phage major capsid protein [Pseudomonadota bacterium]|jgi:HK97 family phage major capsid protein
MDAEIKGLFEEQAKAFEAFKQTNDSALAEVKKLGASDAVREAELKKINDALDGLGDQIKAAEKARQELEAKTNRLSMTGGKGDDAEAKAAGEFGRQLGQDFGVDDLRGYKAALDAYLRKGPDYRDLDRKSLSVGSDPDGGYLVTPDMSGRIVAKVYESSPLRQYASVVTIGTDALEGLIDNDEASAGWVGETQTRSETDTPQLGKWTIPVNEVYAMPTATQKVLEDARLDLESWLANKVADKIARIESAAFINGDGALKPRGLLSYSTVATADATRAWGVFQHIVSGAAADFASSSPADRLLDVVYALKAAYRQGAAWMMPRATVGAIRKFKDGQGQYLWSPGLQAGQPQSILGFPVAEAEDMPAIGANNLGIAFGNFAEGYQIVDRVGLSVLRDPYTTKGFVKFYTRKRVGGGAVNFEAVKFLRFST